MTRMTPLSKSWRRWTVSLFAGGAFVCLAAAAPQKPASTSWASHVTISSIGAFSFGNPAAKVRLIEYFSYTCGKCAEFARTSDAPLKAHYVDKGLVVVEYRNLVRDPVDMTAALLARCGGAKAFVANHNAIFAAQPTWLGKVSQATEAQMKSWYEGSTADRTRKIAVDSGLQAVMRARGYSPDQITACLNDGVAQAEISGMTNIARNADHVRVTPTLFVNGSNTGASEWPAVKSRLDLAIKGS